MHIVFAASECVPFAKTGGLADVVGALPPELVKLGHEVTVYLPLYAGVKAHIQGEWKYAVRSITIPFEHYNRFVGIVDGGRRSGVQYYFVDCPELFDRKELYGTKAGDYPNNWERFGLFCRAVLEAAKLLGVPQVFHVHDWQTALIPVYLRTVYNSDPLLSRAGVVLTIHNAGYQGWFPPVTTERLLFPWDIFTMDKVEQFDNFNFLKGGLVYCDMLTTVSRKYAEEIQTAEFGEKLEGTLRGRAAELRGILNGVDYSKWDPATDGNLAAHYSAKNLAGKQKCRADLLRAGLFRGLRSRRASTWWSGLPENCQNGMWPWWRWAPASRNTRSFSAIGRSGTRRRWPWRFATTTRWPTRSRQAPICFSCPRCMSLAD